MLIIESRIIQGCCGLVTPHSSTPVASALAPRGLPAPVKSLAFCCPAGDSSAAERIHTHFWSPAEWTESSPMAAWDSSALTESTCLSSSCV
jgi:hypothetical protein